MSEAIPEANNPVDNRTYVRYNYVVVFLSPDPSQVKSAVLSPPGIPLSTPYDELFPGGIPFSSTISITSSFPCLSPGVTTLSFGLMAALQSNGAWCAVAGLNDFSLASAKDIGVLFNRLAIVQHLDRNGNGPQVIASLLSGFDAVFINADLLKQTRNSRILAARTRKYKSLLIAVNLPKAKRTTSFDSFSADYSIAITKSRWEGLTSNDLSQTKYDTLQRRLVRRSCAIEVGGRRFHGNIRKEWWLPDSDGQIRQIDEGAQLTDMRPPLPKGA
ncbi:MAG: hypothetical protein HKL80_11140 [Acidimicrobiales bacterium]|nr:hypothetical protein [Acidimicrobiales bacterium]